MRKLILLLLFCCVASLSSMAALTATWRIHNPFDSWPVKVVETPQRVYFLNRTYEYRPNLASRNTTSLSLQYYDKEGDEIIPVNNNNASGTIVSAIAYNPWKKYLLVAYSDCNIDFIYDDGRVENLQALRLASIPGNKAVNSITFDNERDHVYLATSFGYVVLNDKKYEVAESRIFNRNFNAAARCGDFLVLADNSELLFAPSNAPKFNLDEFKGVARFPSFNVLAPLEGNNFLAARTGSNGYIYSLSINPENLNITGEINSEIGEDPNLFDLQQVENGHFFIGNVRLGTFDKTGKPNIVTRPEQIWRMPGSSRNMSELWILTDLKGLTGYRHDSGNNWTMTHGHMRPNSPATFLCTSMAYHPQFGVLAGSPGVENASESFELSNRNVVSGLKNSFWSVYSPIYAAPDKMKDPSNFQGLAIDPMNTDYVYRGSILNGLIRFNLKNPAEITLLANNANPNKDIEGFIPAMDVLAVWDRICRLAHPQFTTDGTLWTIYFDADANHNRVVYWTPEDRLASTNASNYRPVRQIVMPADQKPSNFDVLRVLNHPSNKNLLVIGGFENYGTILVYDHNGTPDVTSDDKYVYLESKKIYDQDGGEVTTMTINNLYEDPETGLVWILAERGVFTFNPRQAIDTHGNVSINRIKVSRNDGTNLADYLLNEVNTMHLATDGEGRKWFSTTSGLVGTSADARTILAEFTTENSGLPDNMIFTSCYNPDNNSMLVATGKGLVEMFPSGSGGSSSGFTEVRVYPNPVEPDYYGWVRIDNIPDGSLVKITDAHGGLVKELGKAESGAAEWDITGLNNTRVATGVYYVMVSSDSGKSSISKILVFN